ncbi:MAG TPA: ATP-binding protein [Spirillospora sp.]
MSVLYRPDAVAGQTRLVLAALAVGAVITLLAALLAADTATRRLRQHSAREQDLLHRRLGELGFLVARGRRDLQRLAAGLRAGQTAQTCREDWPAPDTNDPVTLLAHELQKAQSTAWNTVVNAATREPERGVRRVEVFVNLARRMQTLSHRAIQGLDELENQVEDPDLLKGLFKVDHLTTRTRRQAESLAVIGGASPRRRWTKPVTVYEVLRSAIAEVEQYNRVKVVPPVEGTLHGGAVADVVHLLAELIENATRFSPPQTQVLIRVEQVSAGLAIEVEDRGLGIPRSEQRRLNALLEDHEQPGNDELLKDGRIGLLVVSALARRHNIRVQLQGNVFGGTQAVVVLPSELEGRQAEESGKQQPAAAAEAARPAPAQAGADASGASAGATAGDRPQVQAEPAHRPAEPVSRPAEPVAQPAAAAPRPAPAFRQADPLDTSTPLQTDPGTVSTPLADAGAMPAPPADTRPAPASQTLAKDPSGRPPLPRRQAQTHLAPELAKPPAPPQDDEPGEEDEVEYNSGLMAAFQRGMRSAEEGDAPSGERDSAH